MTMPSIIIYGPAGCGKSYNAARLAKHFGLTRIVDDWANGMSQQEDIAPTGTLYLTSNATFARAMSSACTYSFADAAKQFNDAIPLTDWQSGPPPMVGEWNASLQRRDHARRWWDGQHWSRAWRRSEGNQTDWDYYAGRRSQCSPEAMQWRGLSAEPITGRPA